MTDRRRAWWTDDLIEAVYAELPAKKYQVEPDSWEVHRIIAAVEDWARWEHVPKGTLARLEQAEAAIARVRGIVDADQTVPIDARDPASYVAGYADATFRVRQVLDGQR